MTHVRLPFAFLAVSGVASGCRVVLTPRVEASIRCDDAGACPEGLSCLADVGRCVARGATCTEERDGRLHASSDGNACAGGDTAGVCVRGQCLESSCGDGVVDVTRGELCDDPKGNSDVRADACRKDCRPARCGDGVLDNGEECDDANQDESDACLGTCKRHLCGSAGIVCAAGEVCVDGACRAACFQDSECATDRVCDMGACVARIPPFVMLSTGSLSFFVGAPAVDIVATVDPGPQAPTAVLSWSFVVAPDDFVSAQLPNGPTFTFSPDVVGHYSLEVTATHRSGSTSNMVALQVDVDHIVAEIGHGSGDSIVELSSDGHEQLLSPDFYGAAPAAGLAQLPGHNAIFAGSQTFFGPGDMELANNTPASPEPEIDAASCVADAKVWAIADDGTAACCLDGSSATLATFNGPSYGCCQRGFVANSSSGVCAVSRPRPPTAMLVTTANPNLSFHASPTLAGPSGNCDWSDLPPAPIVPTNVDVRLCNYEVKTMSVASDGSRVAFVLVRRFVSDPTHTPGNAGVAVIVDDISHMSQISLDDGGLPDASAVLLSQEIATADLFSPPLVYLRLSHDPTGARLAVLSGPQDRIAIGGNNQQPSPIASYHIDIYDPTNHASLGGTSRTMRASWRTAMMLLPSDRIVLSPDGLSVQLSAPSGGAPLTPLWDASPDPTYAPIGPSANAALLCAPLCANYATAPAPDLDACSVSDVCCDCLASSAKFDPAVACHALASSGPSGIAISIYDGIAANADATLLSASKITTLVPFTRCDDIFDFESAADFTRTYEIVTYAVSTQIEAAFSVITLTGGAPANIQRIPSTGWLANDSQLSFSLRMKGPPAPPRPYEFWVFNRDGSRPRQLLPDGTNLLEQTNELPPMGCDQAPGFGLGLLIVSALLLRRRSYRPRNECR